MKYPPMMAAINNPIEVEKLMERIKQTTMKIAEAKSAVQEDQRDLQRVRDILSKYGTLRFLRRVKCKLETCAIREMG